MARFIDTEGLPEGFDVADLAATCDDAALIAWMRERVRPGPPPKLPKARGPDAAPVVEVKTELKAEARAARAERSNVVALPKPKPKDEEDPGVPPEYSDDHLADKFAEKHAHELVYVHTWSKWMLWNGERWMDDATLASMDMARKVCRHASEEAASRPDLGARARTIAGSLASARTMGNVERIAKTDRRIAARADQWDRNEWILNTPNGVVELRTGQVRHPKREDFATKMTAVAPLGDCPVWMAFLQRVTGSDAELMDFLQRMIGYCLTGSVRDHAFFFVYGEGGNGKGTFLNTIDYILADYAKVANMEMFTEAKFRGISSDVASLQGARMVTAQETSEGRRWDEQRVKQLTGGDVITARFLYGNEFSFAPTFKLVFAGNHKPMLRNVDEAMKRRLFLIPFTQTIPASERDPLLGEKLRAEAAGILQWAVDGCLEWQRAGLRAPRSVLATTEEYFDENDTIGAFLAECCDAHASYWCRSSALYDRYKQWAAEVGEYELPRRRWLHQIAHKGLVPEKNGSGVMVMRGVQPKGAESPPGPSRQRGLDDRWADEK